MFKTLFLFLVTINLMNSSFASSQDVVDGFNYQSAINNKEFENESDSLDKIYNFQNLAINGKLPPVIICKDKNKLPIDNLLDITPARQPLNCQEIYPARSLYTDEKNKKLFSWRDLLIVKPPSNSISPKNNADFKKGMQKANDASAASIIELNAIYKGMLFYRTLEKK